MTKIASLASSEYLARVAAYERLAPAAYKAFQQLQAASFRAGALSVREKELIAVGCAHVLRCPYCIEHHVKLARQAGASPQEIAEAVWVAVAMAAGACHAHAAVASRTLKGGRGDYYGPEVVAELGAIGEYAPATLAAFDSFAQAAFADGALRHAMKELVAIACAHNTRCPLCIDAHVKNALALSLTPEAIAEAIWVAIEMGAGACFGHSGLAAALLEDAPD